MDVAGLVLCPGFVDIHGHSDLTVLHHPSSTSKIVQGVTTEVAGNCGLGVAPVSSLNAVPAVRSLMAIVDAPAVEWTWRGMADYLARVDQARPAMSVAALAGHLAIRGSVAGLDQRPPTADELADMERLLDRALRDGAVGCSLGLMYPPSAYAGEDELVALARVVARHDALLSVHLRDYGDHLLAAVEEMLRVAERAGCRLQISHLCAVGRRNWGAVQNALDLIDVARDGGVDVMVDIYPYLAGSTNLSQVLPRWAMDGGLDGLRARLPDLAIRRRIIADMASRAVGWDETMLSDVPWAAEQVGCTVAELAAEQRREPAEVVLDLLAVGDPGMIVFGRSEDDLRAVLRHPASMIGSDGLAVDPHGPTGAGLPHPRYFGAYPGLLERYVRKEPVLTIEDAIRRCTSVPADRAGLAGRGRLEPGARADVVVLDLGAVAEMSTYLVPRQPPAGIDRVYAGGRLVAMSGAVTGVRTGGAVRRA